MICPNCQSENVQAVSQVESISKGYGCCKGSIGTIIFGPIGLLCGLCGMGERKIESELLFVCNNCGNKFK
jgi:hypothetical protein